MRRTAPLPCCCTDRSRRRNSSADEPTPDAIAAFEDVFRIADRRRMEPCRQRRLSRRDEHRRDERAVLDAPANGSLGGPLDRCGIDDRMVIDGYHLQHQIHRSGARIEKLQRDGNGTKSFARPGTRSAYIGRTICSPSILRKRERGEYGYKPRDGETSSGSRAFFRSYTGKKQKYMHHTLPLVWSGELRDSTKDFRIEATATSNGSRVRIVLPSSQKANFKNQFTNINMREELTTVSPKEGEELSEILSKAIQRRVNATGQTCNVTIN